MMRARCRIEMDFPDAAAAKAAKDALSHEKDVGGRSKLSVSCVGARLSMDIDADDVVAMRAGANACMRALQVIEDVDEVR